MLSDSPRRPRLSILQVMKLVAYAAVALGCVSPMLHLWRAGVVGGGGARGLVGVAVFEAVAVPLAWAGVSFALLRPGPWKDRLIAGSLAGSASAALGFACWAFFAHVIPGYGNPHEPPERRIGPAYAATHLAVIVLLSAAVVLLLRILWRGPARPGDPSPLADPREVEATAPGS